VGVYLILGGRPTYGYQNGGNWNSTVIPEPNSEEIN
jgi:hypothetical protein